MISVDQASIVKLKTHGTHFEILVDSNAAIAYREGKVKDVASILALPKIYSDSKKGMEASSAQLQQIFNTKDPIEIAKIILEKGDVPLTKEYKDNLREQKRKQIVNYIHRNAVDPKTHAPHPPARIESAMEEVKFHVNEFDTAEHQVQEVIKNIRHILPLKFEIKEISVRIPASYAYKCYAIIKSFGKLLKEDWLQDGSLKVEIEIPGGLEEDLYSKLNAICHGDINAEVLRTK